MAAKRTNITMPELRIETRHKDFVPKTLQKLGFSGLEVERLQDYLTQFGYIQSPTRDRYGLEALMTPPPVRGDFDSHTQEAVSRFQSFNGLPVTGELDETTVDLMAQPRCGFPDIGEFALHGSRWNKTNLTYGYKELTPDLSVGAIKAAIAEAFGLWAAVTPLRFAEVASNNADMIIRFVAGEHGDGFGFDGVGGVLAHAFYPQGGAIAGDIHFDEAETWSVSQASGVDLVTVAAHEIGHALGLAHSLVPGALMAAYYGGPHRRLEQDDVAGIQALYSVA